MEKLLKIHKHDARKILELIPQNFVDVTVTSPPYYDLKDYGYEEQIGFGQTYEDYLQDLYNVFAGVYKVTKDTGSLWVIIDTYRKNGEVIPLPFDFSNKIKDVGWKLQEVIIWKKDKTVPWAHKGQMRSIFEYILVFSKTSNFNFFIDRVRDYESLKKWWVKYPERYNPKGKTPDAIWHFPIPTQGSWGSGYIRHFCPLPEEMIAQILNITTNVGDVVFDPFAGSGAVLAKADNMRRKYIGTELNSEYIKMFKNYLEETNKTKKNEYINSQRFMMSQLEFEELNLNLRVLKYGRLVLDKLIKNKKLEYAKLWIKRNNNSLLKKNSISGADYHFYIPDIRAQLGQETEIVKYIMELISKPPLSKFGIESTLRFYNDLEDFKKILNPNFYRYTLKDSHKYSAYLEKSDIMDEGSEIFSTIKVDLNEKDYE